MYTVVLTGGIGSGKSTIAAAFMKFGIIVIDADTIARQIVKFGTPSLKAIVNHFGDKILDNCGFLNRRLLRQRIFSSPNERDWLNALLHPIIYQKTRYQISKATSPYVLLVLPLLVENQLYKKINRILVVDVTLETQIQRTMLRDQVSRKHIEQILSAQSSREARLSIADDIIDNNGSLNELIPNVILLHLKYVTKASQYRFK